MPTQNIFFWAAMILLAWPIISLMFGLLVGRLCALNTRDEEGLIYPENWNWPERWCDHGEA